MEVFCIVVFNIFFETKIISFFQLLIPAVLIFFFVTNWVTIQQRDFIDMLMLFVLNLCLLCCLHEYIYVHICVLLEFCLVELLVSILCV